jgi:hypothetical protein
VELHTITVTATRTFNLHANKSGPSEINSSKSRRDRASAAGREWQGQRRASWNSITKPLRPPANVRVWMTGNCKTPSRCVCVCLWLTLVTTEGRTRALTNATNRYLTLEMQGKHFFFLSFSIWNKKLCRGRRSWRTTAFPELEKSPIRKHNEGHRPLVHGSLKRQTTHESIWFRRRQSDKGVKCGVEIREMIRENSLTWIWRKLRWTNAQLTSCKTEEIYTHPSYRHIYFTTKVVCYVAYS